VNSLFDFEFWDVLKKMVFAEFRTEIGRYNIMASVLVAAVVGLERFHALAHLFLSVFLLRNEPESPSPWSIYALILTVVTSLALIAWLSRTSPRRRKPRQSQQ